MGFLGKLFKRRSTCALCGQSFGGRIVWEDVSVFKSVLAWLEWKSVSHGKREDEAWGCRQCGARFHRTCVVERQDEKRRLNVQGWGGCDACWHIMPFRDGFVAR